MPQKLMVEGGANKNSPISAAYLGEYWHRLLRGKAFLKEVDHIVYAELSYRRI